ncbi:MAG: hypothetical protein AAGL89_08935 [Pseudomonadota bacterium]
MLRAIKNRLRRFRREDEGSIVAETVIMFPTLFAAVLATFVFFDAFRNQAINLKAAYTISDAMSREDRLITNTMMNNLWMVHRFLTDSPSLTELRISVIQYDMDADEVMVVWSRQKGGSGNYDWANLSDIGLTQAQIPAMPHLETLIVVQTSVDYEPNFSIGLEGFSFDNVVFTRPRWAPQLCYSHNGTQAGRVCPIQS